MSNQSLSPDQLNQSVKEALSFLNGIGYSYHGVSIEETQAIGPYLEAVFLHKYFGQYVRISFLSAYGFNDGRMDSLTVHLEKDDDTFSLDEYLKYHSASVEQIVRLTLASHPGALEDKVRAALSVVAELFKHELSEIIEGKKWVHVPFDWGNYK